MGISNKVAMPPNVPTEQKIQPINDSEWTEYRFLPTPGFENDWRDGPNAIPNVRDWRFSPSGRTGVNIIEGKGIGYVVLLLDVYNKLWFGLSIKKYNIDFKDIFTYHMLDDDTLIVVELRDCHLVKQHIIKVDLQTRKATFERTVVHKFVRRHSEETFSVRLFHGPHNPITVDGKCYTALVGPNSRGGKCRVIVYLVPLDPTSRDKPKEFSFLMELSKENQRKRRLLRGVHYSFDFTGFASAGLLYFISLMDVENETKLLSVYFTVDISKLTDIYTTSIVDQKSLDREQVKFMTLVSDPVLSFDFSSSSNTSHGVFELFKPWSGSEETDYIICQVHETKKTLKIKKVSDSWLNLHPCGAVLQFKMSPDDNRLFVRVASQWKNTSFSLTSTELIFDQNNPIDSMKDCKESFPINSSRLIWMKRLKRLLEPMRST